MKLKKILAAVAAAAVAVSAMAVNTFALSTKDYFKDGTVYINADKPEDPTWAIDAGVDQTTIYGVTFHVTFGSAEWYGGGIGANSPSTGWKSIEWGTNSKEITADVENGTITWLSDAPIFKADDKYAQLWMQIWSGADSMTINSADVLGEGGTVLSTDDAPAAEAKSNVAELNKDAGFIDGQTPSVTITNADFGVTDINKVAIDIAIAPKAGDFEWNDWCGNAVKVTDADGVRYYAWGGAQVTWNNDVDKDEVDDIIGGVNGDQWLGTVNNGAITLDVAVNGDFTIDIITMCYDTYAGTIYTVKTATANGDAAAAAPAEKAEAAPAAEEAPEAEDEDVDVDVEPEEEEEEPEEEPVAETEAPAVEEAPAPAVENATAAPATGNTAVATIAAVMAVAGAAAIVSKKRK